MIGKLYIANCYMFKCKSEILDIEQYLKDHGFQALIFHQAPFEEVNHDLYIVLFDTYNRSAYNCYYDLCGHAMYRMDNCTVAMMLECLGIDIEKSKTITHINIEQLKRVYYQEKGV